ncbi:hypothetical protein [Agromyces binzhouensis]|uniref:Uncharacterized protein n=1 Tax=Agromyces binzhouensis TaxID=1817495 RepID=A0A4Q2JXW9_9MICO|nr:hypothetical protein [Agromyces binzhouensis]RXZ51639.1 hypothetical protein ESO86_01485 [Agromyces binzhouensis]
MPEELVRILDDAPPAASLSPSSQSPDTLRRLRRWDRMKADLALSEEHLEHLRDQLGFIDASCARFDTGVHAEAKRLAIAVRVLAYDTAVSTGLLTRMGVTQVLPWADGTIPGGPRVVRRAKELGVAPVGSLLTVIPSEADATWAPAFSQVPLGPHRVGFTYWWQVPRIFDNRGTEASRREVVLWLAHHDGGAHVDTLPDAYRAIARGSSVGDFFSRLGRSAKDDSPVPAAMRQIAEEVRFTVRSALGDSVG